MFLDKLTIKARLFLAILAPCLALLIVAIMSLGSMGQIQTQTEAIYLNTAHPMRSMAEVSSRIPRMRVGIDMMLLQQVPALQDQKGVMTRVKETREEDIPQLITSLEQAVAAQVNPEMKREVESLKAAMETMVAQELTPMLAAFEQGDMLPPVKSINNNTPKAMARCVSKPQRSSIIYWCKLKRSTEKASRHT